MVKPKDFNANKKCRINEKSFQLWQTNTYANYGTKIKNH